MPHACSDVAVDQGGPASVNKAQAAARVTMTALSYSLPAMRNPLQEQLLKAGLAKKAQVDKVAREQNKNRVSKAANKPAEDKIDTRRLQAEHAERDRALEAQRKAQTHANELRAQVRQIVDTNKVALKGETAYRFSDGELIRTIYLDAPLRAQLARGQLVIVRHADDYALLPRPAAEKVRDRDAALIVLDHGATPAGAPQDEDDPDEAHYRQFEVPDDLIW